MADKVEQFLVILVVGGFVIVMLFVSVSWVAASAAARVEVALRAERQHQSSARCRRRVGSW